MRVAVLGGTGRTGRLVVPLLIERGHQVRALTRSGDIAGVEQVSGQATDPADVAALVEGCDAVIAALASSNKDAVCSQATEAVIAAARSGGPRRYIAISGAGVDAPGDAKGVPDKAIGVVMKLVVGGMLRDRQRELETVRASALEWTFARPPRLTDGAPKGYRTSLKSPPSSAITRADLAAFLVDQLGSDEFVHAAPFVSN